MLVRAQSISVLFKPSDEGVPSPLLRQTLKVLRLMDCYHPPQVVAGVSTWCFSVFCVTTSIVLPVTCFCDRTVYDFQGAMDTCVLETCTCLWHRSTRTSDVKNIRTHFHPMPKGGLCPIWAFPFVKSVRRGVENMKKGLVFGICLLLVFLLVPHPEHAKSMKS